MGPGSGVLFNRYSISVGEDEKVVETEGGGDYTTR